MFCEILEELHNWERLNIPGPYRGVGLEVLLWLVRANKHPKALKDLYLSSRFSEPTVRECLRGFQDGGYVVIRSNDDDMRTRFAVTTEKLEQLLREYQRQLAALSRHAREQGWDSLDSGGGPARETSSVSC